MHRIFLLLYCRIIVLNALISNGKCSMEDYTGGLLTNHQCFDLWVTKK